MSHVQTQKDFYTHNFTHNPFLLRCILSYYKNYIYNVPKKFFSTLHPHMYDFLQQKPHMAVHEAFFLQNFGIKADKSENFAPQPARIALLPQDYLPYMVLTIGMALCQEDICTTVLKKEVQALRNMESLLPLPQEALLSPYAFTLQKAVNYQGHCQYVRQQASICPLTKDFDTFDLDVRILLWGLWSVLSCSAQGGRQLTLRTLVLLDAITNYAPPLQALKETFYSTDPQSTQALAWPLLRVLLFKEIHCPWEEGWPVFFA